MRPENNSADPANREDEPTRDEQHEDLRLDTEVLEGPQSGTVSGVAGGTKNKTV